MEKHTHSSNTHTGAQRTNTSRQHAAAPGSANTPVRKKASGHAPAALIDKLGERIAFERTGVQRYEAMVAKAEAAGASTEKIDRLKYFWDEEAAHREAAITAMASLGAEVDAAAPSADPGGISGQILQMITDPDTSMAQSLDALMTAALIDNAAWDLLIDLARDAGQADMAASFEQILQQKQDHLGTLRIWLREALGVEHS